MKFEDIKGIVRNRKWMKGRQYNCHKKNGKGTNNNLQNTTQEAKD
jgi:hypothetical protein